MGLFDRFKKDKFSNVTPANIELPISHSNINQSVQKNGIYIQRDDGTYLDIAPKLDTAGHQMYRQVYNPVKKEIQNLGIWLVDYKTAGAMEATDTEPDIQEVYLEECINSDWFTNKTTRDVNGITLQEFLANKLLSRERLLEIIEHREGYAGGVRIDDKVGFIKRTYSDISREIRMEKQTGIPSSLRHRNDVVKSTATRQTDYEYQK